MTRYDPESADRYLRARRDGRFAPPPEFDPQAWSIAYKAGAVAPHPPSVLHWPSFWTGVVWAVVLMGAAALSLTAVVLAA